MLSQAEGNVAAVFLSLCPVLIWGDDGAHQVSGKVWRLWSCYVQRQAAGRIPTVHRGMHPSKDLCVRPRWQQGAREETLLSVTESRVGD